MIEIDPEQSEFRVKTPDRRRVNCLCAVLPLMRCFVCVFPPLKRRLCHWIHTLYERYAGMAYYYDDGDVGFFESFLLDESELDEILNDLNKRTTAWLKDSIMQADRGIRPSMDGIDDLNMRCSLSDKKIATLRLVFKKDKVIQFFSKRIEKQDPLFYRRIHRIWMAFCPQETTVTAAVSPSEKQS